MFSSDLAPILSENEPIGRHTWFGLGGAARWMARPADVDQLVALVRQCRSEGIEIYKLGQGANLLVADEGVDGMVVRLNTPTFQKVQWGKLKGDVATVVAAAGADMNRLARDAVRRGLAGLEVMGGIPGTLGGIVRMNAGGKFGQISDVVRDITVVDGDGKVRQLSAAEIGFSYRHTNLGDAVVCGVTLQLRRDDPKQLRQRFLEIWEYKRKSQPLADYSAGCVFKNPPNQSAGALIDRAGLKNRSVGGAYVEPIK
jgi:UDP-N-acetylmuramate dehydrogenase